MLQLVRYLWKFNRDRFLLIFALGLTLSALTTSFAGILKKILNSLETLSASYFYFWLATGFIIVTFSLMLRYYHALFTDSFSEDVILDLRLHLLKNYLSPSNRAVSHMQHSKVLSLFFNDLTILFNGVRFTFDFIKDFFTLIGLVGFLFFLNFFLSLVLLGVFPVLYFTSRKLLTSIVKYSRTSQSRMDFVTRSVREMMDTFITTITFQREKEILQKADSELRDVNKSKKTYYSRMHLVSPMSEFIAVSVGIVLLFFIFRQIRDGMQKFSDFATFATTFFLISRPIKSIQDITARSQEISVALDRITAFVTSKEKNKLGFLSTPEPDGVLHSKLSTGSQNNSFVEELRRTPFLLRVDNLNVVIDGISILQAMNVTCKKGEKIGIVGPSGSGKTTFFKALLGLVPIQNGTIELGGLVISETPLSVWQQSFSYVGQSQAVISGTLEENITWFDQEVNYAQLELAIEKASLTDFTHKLPQGLQSRVGEGGASLSGGEMQRVALARAFYFDRPIILLDETTSQLDTQNEALIQKGLHLMQGKLILAISHNPSFLGFCDRIFKIKEGKLTEDIPGLRS